MDVLLPVPLASITVDSLEGLFLIDGVCPRQRVAEMQEISCEHQLSEILLIIPFCFVVLLRWVL